MEGGGGARAWPQVVGVGGAHAGLYQPLCLAPSSITSPSQSLHHHLALVITSLLWSPSKVGLMNWPLVLSRELRPRVLRLAQVPLG